MNELVLADKSAEWRRLKALVLDSVSSPISRRVYNLGLDEFFAWFSLEPRPGFTKATVAAWRVALEARGARRDFGQRADHGSAQPATIRGGCADNGPRPATRWPVVHCRSSWEAWSGANGAIPARVKVAIDAWTSAAGIADGSVFRPVHRNWRSRLPTTGCWRPRSRRE